MAAALGYMTGAAAMVSLHIAGLKLIEHSFQGESSACSDVQ
jgi:hypothetical protein